MLVKQTSKTPRTAAFSRHQKISIWAKEAAPEGNRPVQLLRAFWEPKTQTVTLSFLKWSMFRVGCHMNSGCSSIMSLLFQLFSLSFNLHTPSRWSSKWIVSRIWISACIVLRAYPPMLSGSRSIVVEAIIQRGSTMFSTRDMKLRGKYRTVVPRLSGEPRIECKFLLTPSPSKGVVTEYHHYRREQLVALKILTADVSKDNTELSMLLHLSRSTLKHPGKEYVVQLLDYFEHVGPNGTHLCLVLPFMVINGSDIVLSFKPTHAEYVRSISRQLSLGLDYLHAEGILHCGKFTLS